MKKKIISLLLILALAVCIFPASAFALTNVDESIASTAFRSTASDGYCIWVGDSKFIVPYGTVISEGSRGDAVYVAQRKFNEMFEKEGKYGYTGFDVGYPDSIFGERTKIGAITFQTWYNVNSYDGVTLTVDGIIGPMSWKCMAHIMYL